MTAVPLDVNAPTQEPHLFPDEEVSRMRDKSEVNGLEGQIHQDQAPAAHATSGHATRGKLRVYLSRTGGNDWEPLTRGLPQSHCYVNVLRDATAIDTLDPCGIYFGTTGGQVYSSADAGDTWEPIVRDLPAVLSVEAQTLS